MHDLASTAGEIQQDDIDAGRLRNLAQLRHSSGAILKSCLRMHRQVPIGLGSGSGGIEHKVRAILQKFWVEALSAPALRSLCSRLRGVCVDMGTELSIADMCGQGPRELLPDWMQQAAPFDDDEMDHSWELPGGQCLRQHVFPLTMLSAGSVHICNNLSKDMDSALPGWTAWMQGFSCMAYLIHHPWLRTRIVGRLLLGTPREGLRSMFDHGCPLHATWRWGSVAECVKPMLKLRTVLPCIWDPQKFVEARGSGEGGKGIDDETKSKLNIPLLTRSIRSKEWWGYTMMIHKLHSSVGKLTAWCEGCVCHSWMRQARQAHTADSPLEVPEQVIRLEECRRLLQLKNGDGDGRHFLCPMSGKRAPEMARGEYLDVIRSSVQEQRVALLTEVGDVSSESLDSILSDFDLGLHRLEEIAKVKFGFWSQLPWMLASLADWSEGRARVSAQKILAAFDSQPQDERLHHRISWFFQKYIR